MSQYSSTSATPSKRTSGCASRSAKAEQSYARRQRLHIRSAILTILKRALIRMHNDEEYDEMPQKPITLTSLAYQLNEKFQRE